MKYHLIILLFFLLHFANAQNKMAFKSGEWFKYKLSYSGWFKAGEATVNLSEVNSNNKLLHRGTNMICDSLNISREEASILLIEHGSVRKAINAYNGKKEI